MHYNDAEIRRLQEHLSKKLENLQAIQDGATKSATEGLQKIEEILLPLLEKAGKTAEDVDTLRVIMEQFTSFIQLLLDTKQLLDYKLMLRSLDIYHHARQHAADGNQLVEEFVKKLEPGYKQILLSTFSTN
jgi:hypothetical protein